jgi:hypothetical protein
MLLCTAVRELKVLHYQHHSLLVIHLGVCIQFLSSLYQILENHILGPSELRGFSSVKDK